MSPRTGRRRAATLPLAVVALLPLAGCSSIGDFGRLQDPVVADNIHAWVGQAAAARAGAPISFDNLTEDERALRDLAFPLIEPSYDRIRWDAVVYEYGQKREFRRSLLVADPTAYYRHLLADNYRSTAGRYNQLIDDIRDDVVRIGSFFDMAHRVLEIDRRRQASMNLLPNVSALAKHNALARVGENTFTIAWVQNSLAQRCAGYRLALDHLVVAEPENMAAQADVALVHLQQQIAANQLVQVPAFAAAVPGEVASRPAPVVR
jgi:hypothetical protein